jgi:hypothetical protein
MNVMYKMDHKIQTCYGYILRYHKYASSNVPQNFPNVTSNFPSFHMQFYARLYSQLTKLQNNRLL